MREGITAYIKQEVEVWEAKETKNKSQIIYITKECVN
jgi:hypothetical protein